MNKEKILIDNRNEIQELIFNGTTFTKLAELYGYSKGYRIKEALLRNGFIIYDKNGERILNETPIFKCKFCGQEFESKFKLAGHVTTCKKNPKYEDNLKNLEKGRFLFHEKEKNIFYCKFCGKETFNKGACVVHENSCEKNPNRKPHPNGDRTYVEGRASWNKGKTALTDERVLKARNTRKERIEKGEIIIKGRPHSEKSKSLLRKKMINYIRENGNGEFGQHYSIKGCKYIDELNKKNNWKLQHALNGGEIEVDGYFLDGYDKELNIAFEYDEPKHYEDVFNNILNIRDIERQKHIIECLSCRFFRYNEKLGLLYEVEQKI